MLFYQYRGKINFWKTRKKKFTKEELEKCKNEGEFIWEDKGKNGK